MEAEDIIFWHAEIKGSCRVCSKDRIRAAAADAQSRVLRTPQSEIGTDLGLAGGKELK